jgi:hypothetical protein
LFDVDLQQRSVKKIRGVIEELIGYLAGGEESEDNGGQICEDFMLFAEM